MILPLVSLERIQKNLTKNGRDNIINLNIKFGR